jgi:type IV secretory pathway VirB10-like protein
MKVGEWVKNLFYSETGIETGKREFRTRRALICLAVFFLIFLLCKSIFGESKPQPDDANYKAVPVDTVAREGTVIVKLGELELVKKGKDKPGLTPSGYSSGGGEGDQGQVISRKDRAHSEYVLPAGTKIQVTLDGDLNSQLNQSPVVAQVNSTFSFKGKKLIPVGTKILGRVAESSDSERIGVAFDQLVYPNGTQISASSMALMGDGSPGIIGDFHSGRWTQFAGSVGLSFISGAAAAMETTQANAFGFDQPDQSARNAILNGLSRSTLDQGKRVGEGAQNKKGYVTIPSGANFDVYFEKEVDLSGVIQ